MSNSPSVTGLPDDVDWSGVTTVAGVNVVAALADTGKQAKRCLLRARLLRSLRGFPLGPTLSKLVDVCMCALINAFNTSLGKGRSVIGHAYGV